MQLSFKTKALLFFCPVIILVAIAYTLMTIRAEQGLLRDEIVKRGELLATVAARSAELPFLAENQELLDAAASSVNDIGDVSFVTFYDLRLQPVAHKGATVPSPNLDELPLLKPVSVVSHLDHFYFYAPVFSVRASEDMDIFQDSELAEPQQEHIGWVCVGLSTAVMEKTAANMARDGALFAALLVVIAIVLVQVLLGIVFRPLNVLVSAVQGLQEGEYPEVPPIDTNDEIGQLATEFNKMSHAIQDREQRLLLSQKRIRELFERVEHAIFRLDSELKVTEGNRKFGKLCDEGADFVGMIEDGDRGALVKAALKGELVGAETVIRTKDAARHTIFLSLYPEVEEGRGLIGFDGHFVDVTEIKIMEEALRQTQKMEAIGSLAGGVAHDFNNILTSILGYSEIVLMQLPEGDPIREKIKVIYTAGNRAASLTKQLLAFSRKQVMELKVLDLNELIRNMAKMLGRLIGEDVELKMFLRALESNIKADQGQIEQIIMNLTVNARDAMVGGGSLIFETHTVSLDEAYSRAHPETLAGDYVVLIVTDSGCGMSHEVQEKIFEPFFTTKQKGAGTGLGLATVYGIVKQHKGNIFVYSEQGRGTTFKIYFPRDEGKAESMADVPHEEAMSHGTETILVVDDEPSIRHMIIDTLKPLGYEMHDAASGAEALAICERLQGSIDLILTDVIMPRMSGRELAEELAGRNFTIPVLFMSGYTDNVIVHQGVLEPGRNFINKPLVGSMLVKKIRKILDSSREEGLVRRQAIEE